MIDIAQYVAYDIPMTVSVPCHFDSKLPGDRYRIKAVIPPYRCDLWSNKQVKQRQKMIKEPSPNLFSESNYANQIAQMLNALQNQKIKVDQDLADEMMKHLVKMKAKQM